MTTSDADVESYGRRLFVQLVQSRAKEGHPVPFALSAAASDPDLAFHEISYADLNAAADACAWIVHHALQDTPDFTTFAWLGPVSDLRYFAMLLAAMKTRKKVFFTSPRNSLAAQLSLFEQCDCKFIFTDDKSTFAPLIDQICTQRPVQVINVPPLQTLATSNPDPYNSVGEYDDCWLDPVCVLHTSGSTGIPKAVIIKHHYWTAVDALNRLPHMGMGRFPLTKLHRSKNFIPMPLFHCGGLLCGSAFTVYFDHTLVSVPDLPLTAEAVNTVLERVEPNYVMLPASTIKDLVEEEAYHKNVKKAEYFTWGGSPLASDVGAELFKLTNSLNTFGMTEASCLPVEALTDEDWPYHRFSPVLGAEFRPVGANQYEMVIVRKPEYKLFQVVFSTFPELEEFHTKDLWAPHPSKTDMWSYRGRLDDIVVFSNGEKINPSNIERAVTSHPQVSGALVLGQGQFQAGLLVEPKQPCVSSKDRDTLLESLWPIIQNVNRDMPNFGRISKDLVIFSDIQKPLPRAAKGSIQRMMAMTLYAKEIDKLYSASQLTEVVPNGAHALMGASRAGLQEALHSIVIDELGIDSLAANEDFFSSGMDSLVALNISRQVNRYLGKPLLTSAAIYKNPNLDSLTQHLMGEKPSLQRSRSQNMRYLFEEISFGLPINSRPAKTPERLVVMLVGSTGSLGPQILHQLSQIEQVEKIYCLDRSSAARDRHKQYQVGGMHITDSDRVSFLKVSQDQEDLGLAVEKYRLLLREVTHIIHNSWPVNFNMPLESFAPSLKTVRQIVDFAALSLHGASIRYVSSVSTVVNWLSRHDATNAPVPEAVIEDWTVSSQGGYGESKHISERLLAKAAAICGISGSIFRVGQICGSSERGGMWPKQEWLPSLIASSRFLKALPASLGSNERIEWVPVDLLGKIIVDLALQHSQPGSIRVHNLINPRVTTWASLAPTVTAYFESRGIHLRSVSLRDWVDVLKASASAAAEEGSTKALEENPAVKLVTFFETLADSQNGAPELSMTETQASSEMLAEMPPVSPEWMKMWLEQWDF